MLLHLVLAILLLVNTTIAVNQHNSSFISGIKAEVENNMREELKKEMRELKKSMGAWLDEKESEMRRELALSVKK